MEAGRRLLEAEDSDVLGQDGVEGPEQDRVGEGEGAPEAGHLAEGVDAGVGPSGAVDGDLFPGHPEQGLLQDALDGAVAGLALPAAEVRAVVAEDDAIGLHVRAGSPSSASRTASSGVSAGTTPLTAQVPRPTTVLPWILP